MARSKQSAVITLKCPSCGAVHPVAAIEENSCICPGCSHYFSMSAHTRIACIADEGTFRELDREMVSVDPLEFADLKSYRLRLQEARRETGVREAVTTGFCQIGHHRAVLVVFDFAFLGGTMGSVVEKRLPMLSKKPHSSAFPW